MCEFCDGLELELNATHPNSLACLYIGMTEEYDR